MYKVLQDLSLAMLGTSGIPHDSRHIFKTFSRMPSVSLTGLLCEAGAGLTSKVTIRNGADTRHAPDYFGFARFFGAISGNKPDEPFLGLGGFGDAIDAAVNQVRRFRMAPVPPGFYADVIWRLYFEKSLPAEDRATILKQDFAVTNLNYRIILERLKLPSLFAPKLRTEGYDFFVTPDSRPIVLSRGTTKLMRYHDPIPLLHPDTMGHIAPTREHYRLTARAAGDGYFVCNSEPTENDLVKLFPKARGRSVTIPCALAEVSAGDNRTVSLRDIVRTRLSSAATGRPEIRNCRNLAPDARYIMSLSTLEPRKNFERLIRAWELVRHQYAPDLKLVIVGRPGWRYDRILEAIRPHSLAGDLLHLQDVPLAEVQSLYRQAECFVLPSLAEGFGFPPMEALQCGTPSVVSDIPALRWVCGDAALYCNPYDVTDIADKIAALVVDENAAATRARLLRAGAAVLRRYSMDTTAGQWDELFGRLKRGEPPRRDAA